MSPFFVCINAVAPVFLMMAVGYAAKRAGIIREEQVPAMNKVAFRIFMPMITFYNVYSSDLSTSVRPRLMLFAVTGILLMYAASVLWAGRRVTDRARRGVTEQGLFRSNYLILGVPVATSLVGGAEVGVISVLAAVAVPLFNVLAVVALESNNGEKSSVKKLVFSIVKNPLVVGSVTGIVFLLLGLRLPAPLETAVRDMGRAASPLLLVLLGAFFRFDSFAGQGRELTAVCLGRLMIFPAVALGAAVLLGFRGVELVAILTLFASSTAVNSFTMAQQMGGDAALAGNIVVLTSLLCSLTLFLWSLLLKSAGLF